MKSFLFPLQTAVLGFFGGEKPADPVIPAGLSTPTPQAQAHLQAQRKFEDLFEKRRRFSGAVSVGAEFERRALELEAGELWVFSMVFCLGCLGLGDFRGFWVT